jgi:hypothetical protein
MKRLTLYLKLIMTMGIIAIVIIPAQAVSPDSLKAAITSRFKLTTRNLSLRIQERGTVLVIQKEGLRADPPKMVKVVSVIENDNLVSEGGGGLFSEGTGRTLKVGERLYLYGVKIRKNFVNFSMGTVETFDIVKKGTTQSQPYELFVKFQYEDAIDGLSAERIFNDIYVWLKPEEDVASSTKTISLGMSSEQVIEILDIPEKTIDLGSKKILVYKDIKITLVDDKVTDVQ